MDEIKRIFSENLIRLRRKSGMTQAELGEKLNYSDKSISKWERGEALPDVYVLKQISLLFDITVDSLLSPYDEKTWRRKSRDMPYSSGLIISISVLAIWILAIVMYEVLYVQGIIYPKMFLICIPLSLVVVLIMRSVWNQGKYNFWVISALVISLFVVLYFIFWEYHILSLLLMAVIAEIIVCLYFYVYR